jgi:excisionase family DNA binding protein
MNNGGNRALPDDLISMGELADLLRLHVCAPGIYRLLRQGKLRAFKVGSGWAFSREAVGQAIRRQASR